MVEAYRWGIVVPVYNHGAALENVIKQLLSYDVPVIVVDDGNDDANKAYITKVAADYSQVVLVVRQKNGGKGRAMNDGVRKAQELGLTHILQIDSDGQHDASRISRFLTISQNNPKALVCGYPEYDRNAPKNRVNGRKIANFFVSLVTLSKSIKDAMIGFRIYPVAPYCKCLNRHAIVDGRMGYDIDILVHLSWAGVPVISESVKVSYPSDGISNFRLFHDNVRISLTYARLCIGMFVRFPFLLFRNLKKLAISGK